MSAKYKALKNPRLTYMLGNLIIMVATFYIVVAVFPFSNANPHDKYFEPYLIYIVLSFICGISFKKYLPYKIRPLKKTLHAIFKSDFLALVIAFAVIFLLPSLLYSVYAFLAFVGVQFLLEFLVIMVYYAFRYALNVENIGVQKEISRKANVLHEDYPLDDDTRKRTEQLISKRVGNSTLRILKKKIRLAYGNTHIIDTSNIFNVQNLQKNRYSTIVNLAKVNNIRGINDFFVSVHDSLPYEGLFVGCFLTKSQHKKAFLSRYPIGLNYVLYSFDYLFKRLFPKWGFTREIYFWFTNGKRRVLSKAEVFGRLYACGFEVADEFKSENLHYFVARKKNEPVRREIINYGPVIKLNRVGKDGKMFKFYKFRTMHPYSEFLQPYIYEKNSLQEGGKFARDIRVTTLGKFMRRYWLDELPMLLNIFKGDMKPVGIRPLSKHYFSLYPAEVQAKRTKVKPGLLPPFYADMPTTLDEIIESENRYLDSCFRSPILTDIRYFFKIWHNILFKHAHSY